MRYLMIIIFGLFSQITRADTLIFESVPSVGNLGHSNNWTTTETIQIDDSYLLGEIAWNGWVSPQPDPQDPTNYPSRGRELKVRVTHINSDLSIDFNLGGNTGFMDIGLNNFEDFSLEWNSLQVEPENQFYFEFFESYDDFEGADAIWDNITFEFKDNFKLLADFNNDDRVDGNDFLIWQSNFGKINYENGDANRDGKVNGNDFLIWQADFGKSIHSPEPTTYFILINIMLWISIWRYES